MPYFYDPNSKTSPLKPPSGGGIYPGNVNPGGSLLDPGGGYRANLGVSSGAAGNFANQAQGNFFGRDQGQLDATNQYLQGQMTGQNSVSAEQLRQGVQQNVAAQQAQAASASPQNQAMAARLASMNSARLGYGMSGQQAVAGLQERNQAAQTLAQLQEQQRQQDMQATLGGYGTAVQGYGSAVQNPGPNMGSIISGAGSSILGFAASDRRLKTDVKDADGEAARLLDGLKSYRFRYKDARYGKGEQVGVMAQEMERVGLKHAVIDTPQGKMVDGAKTATSALALTAALARRVSRLEKR